MSEILSEDWLLENLPEGWTYDCIPFGPDPAFTITATDGRTMTLPIRLLRGSAEGVWNEMGECNLCGTMRWPNG